MATLQIGRLEAQILNDKERRILVVEPGVAILSFEQFGPGVKMLMFGSHAEGGFSVTLTKTEVKQLRAWALQQAINDITEF